MCAVIRPLIRWGMQSYILQPKTYESNISKLASDHFIDFKHGKLGRIAIEMGLGFNFASRSEFSYTTYISMPFISRYFQSLRNLDYITYIMLPNIVKLVQTWKYNKENVASRCIRLLGKGLLVHTGFAIGASSALLSEKFNYLFMIFALPILDWFADYVIPDVSIDNKNIKNLSLSEYLDQSDFTRIINWDAPNIYTTMAKVNDNKNPLRDLRELGQEKEYSDELLQFSPKGYMTNSIEERVNVQKKTKEAMKTGKVVQCRLFPRRAFDADDEGDRHFRTCESQFMRTAKRLETVKGIRGLKEVVYVINPALMRKFEMKKNEMEKRLGSDGENEMILAWHGTTKTNIDSIVK
eukprot:233784_1